MFLFLSYSLARQRNDFTPRLGRPLSYRIHDIDMREPLFECLEATHGKVRIIEEKRIGRSRGAQEVGECTPRWWHGPVKGMIPYKSFYMPATCKSCAIDRR
jgi:hypothetical protein